MKGAREKGARASGQVIVPVLRDLPIGQPAVVQGKIPDIPLEIVVMLRVRCLLPSHKQGIFVLFQVDGGVKCRVRYLCLPGGIGLVVAEGLGDPVHV
ncbi:MAG TPA: DUF1472 domain-containing protein [Methanoregulaceae archaeon]|nr:DUF1472 domain-containing protein [Methanoregulaceae archaeon]